MALNNHQHEQEGGRVVRLALNNATNEKQKSFIPATEKPLRVNFGGGK